MVCLAFLKVDLQPFDNNISRQLLCCILLREEPICQPCGRRSDGVPAGGFDVDGAFDPLPHFTSVPVVLRTPRDVLGSCAPLDHHCGKLRAFGGISYLHVHPELCRPAMTRTGWCRVLVAEHPLGYAPTSEASLHTLDDMHKCLLPDRLTVWDACLFPSAATASSAIYRISGLTSQS